MEDDLRKLFHAIANKQNTVSMKAGLKARMAEVKNFDSMSKDELIHEIKQSLEDFAAIEKIIMEAGELSAKLKENVYTSLNMKKFLD